MQRSLNSCNKAVSLILVDAFREFENLGILEKKCGYAKIKTEFKKFVLKHPELKSDSRIRDILTHRSYNTQSVTRFISDLPEGEELKEQYVKEQPECFQKKAGASDDSKQTSIQSQRIDQLSDRLTKMKQRHDESEKLHKERYTFSVRGSSSQFANGYRTKEFCNVSTFKEERPADFYRCPS